jgi:hypothetical protein
MNLGLISRGVKQIDDRLFGRAFRQVFTLRKKFTTKLLKTIIDKNLHKDNKKKKIYYLTLRIQWKLKMKKKKKI